MLLNTQFYLYFPEEDEIIIKFKKYNVRKFFDGQIQFSNTEIQQIQQFRQAYKIQKEDSFILRMLYATKFKFDKCISAIKTYDEWRLKYINANQPILEQLNLGLIYYNGRDNRFRPIIVVNARRIAENKDLELTLQTISVFLDYVLNNCMLPGQIENWIVILDLGQLGITGLPKQDLYRIMNYLSSNYRSRMHKCYVVNCSKALTLSWTLIKSFLEDVTVHKILFENPPLSLLQYANSQQVEKKFGGQAKDKCESFWPPQEVSQEYQLKENQIKLIDKQFYQELYRTGKLQKNIICKELITEERQEQQQQQIQQNQQQNDESFQSCDSDQT